MDHLQPRPLSSLLSNNFSLFNSFWSGALSSLEPVRPQVCPVPASTAIHNHPLPSPHGARPLRSLAETAASAGLVG